MPQLGSVCAASVKALTAGSSEKECSRATARLTWACAGALHDVLKSTTPSFSTWAETAVTAPTMSTTDTKAVERDLDVMTHLLLRVSEPGGRWTSRAYNAGLPPVSSFSVHRAPI